MTLALREHYGRSIGFFLKSDRAYPSMQFQRDRLFEYPALQQLSTLWGVAFNNSELQYKDMFEFLVQQRYHFIHDLGNYHFRLGQGEQVEPAPPQDPLVPYAELLNTLFPQYNLAASTEDVPTSLFVELPSKDVIPFSDLSAGEKEVFFILSFFLRHNVSNAILVVDEPELHLHPSLSRLLLQTMLTIRPGNQIWVATHNGEVVDEAGRDRVFYVARNDVTSRTEIIPGTDEPASVRALRDMFGYAGYIGIAKRLVFLEGREASADRKVFSWLFPEHARFIKFVPALSSGELGRINAAVLAIMEGHLGWMEFFLIRDRDYLSTAAVDKYRTHSSGRLFVLSRNQIENYLLEDGLISRVLGDIFNVPRTSTAVGDMLRRTARELTGVVLRDMIESRMHELFMPEDFSLGEMLKGQPILTETGEWIDAPLAALTGEFAARVGSVSNGLQERTSTEALDSLLDASRAEVVDAFMNDSKWKSVFPGKQLISGLAREAGVDAIALTNSLIRELGSSPEEIPDELAQIVATVAKA